MLQQVLNIVQVVAFLGSFTALASRLFEASRPFWSRLPAWCQTFLPALVPALAALTQGLTGVKSWGDLSVLFVVCLAMLLPGLPSNRSAAPLPSTKNPVKVPPLVGLMLCLALALPMAGCGWFKSAFWPVVEHCAPSPASLVSEVAEILAAGGDYESALEQAGLKDGKDLVLCAVEAFVSSAGSKVGASAEEGAALARGKAFLAEQPVGK